MQSVILCAGKGTRMMPLTESTPKPLLKVCGKPILEHIVEALPEAVTELVLVVGYLGDQVRDYCGEEFHGRKVVYVEQENYAGGTGDALMCAKPLIKGKFLVLNGDDIHGSEQLRKAVSEENALISVYSETPKLFGVIQMNEDKTLKAIIEKPENPTSNLVNTGGFVAQPSLLDVAVSKSNSGEIYATDMLTAYAQDHPVKIIEQDMWIPIGYPDQIDAAEAQLCAAV